jgi:hypothetical protein
MYEKLGLKKEDASQVGAPILKRAVVQQRKNRIKGCLEGESSKKASATDIEKAKKIICGKFKCPNYHELDRRKNSPKCPFNGTKKGKCLIQSFFHTWHISNFFNLVQEKKDEKKYHKKLVPKRSFSAN